MNQGANEKERLQYESPIVLLKQPEKLKHHFYESTTKSTQLIHSHEYEQSVLYLNKALDLLDIGKDILKGTSSYWKTCIYGNFALVYQKLWQIERCSKYCEKVQHELKLLFQEQNRKEYRLNITKQLMRIKFQRCALLSQMNKHELALQVCKAIFPLLQIFLMVILGHIEGKLKSEKNLKKRENISFTQEVYEFSKKINENLIKSLKQAVNSSMKQPFYFWQKNPEKNEQQVVKKFIGTRQNEHYKKSILGVTKEKEWMNNFTISSVMHLSAFKLQNFQNPLPLQEYVFKDKIYESILYCSLIHFTLATQMRFIEFERQKNQIQSLTGKTGYIPTKYGYGNKTKQFLLSQAYHLRAIHIISSNVQYQIPYLSHIIRSYEKHYIVNKPLEKISSIAEESLIEERALERELNRINQIQFSQRNKISEKKAKKKKSKSSTKRFTLKNKKRKQEGTLKNIWYKLNKSHSKSENKNSETIHKKKGQNSTAKRTCKKIRESQVSFYGSIQRQRKLKSESKLSTSGKRKVRLPKFW